MNQLREKYVQMSNENNKIFTAINPLQIYIQLNAKFCKIN